MALEHADTYDVDNTIYDLNAFKKAAGHSLIDDQTSQDGSAIIYTLDYNVMYRYLWGEKYRTPPNEKGRSTFYDNLSRFVLAKSLDYRSASRFRFSITDATLLEAIEQISHKHDYYAKSLTSSRAIGPIFGQLRSMLDIARRTFAFSPTDAVKLLQDLSRQLPNDSITSSTGRLLALLKSGHITLFERIFGPQAIAEVIKKHGDEFDALVERFFRLRQKIGGRDFEHNRFHYQIDAFNLILSQHLNPIDTHAAPCAGPLPFFICKESLRESSGNNDIDRFSRTTLAPFIKLHACSTAHSGEDMARHVGKVLREIYHQADRRIKELDECRHFGILTSDDVMATTEFFYRFAWSPLAKEKNEENNMEFDLELERVSRILKDQRSLLEYFDQASAEALSGGESLMNLREMDLGLAELRTKRDISENPHLLSQLKKLGLEP